ncbi:MAG TPA: tetrahydrofolate dehydrogenase/cyclohydrolase catalytic domain-containing protein [Acidimicrobiia bacterium]|nr:tetrahydrofolate dehydrogenase/cyclohydrolase catalytic domain-containing protein [Acidimicrobiia bacterium]
MTATILDGNAAAAAIREDLRQRVAVLASQGVTPGLATVLIGDDPGSRAYVKMKHKDCAEVGIHSVRHDLPAQTERDEAIFLLEELNGDPAIDGYIVQLPVPDHLDPVDLLMHVDPAKDADGLHPVNLGYLALGFQAPRPCTPLAIQDLLARHKVPVAGRHVVIVGRGTTVGRPLAMLLSLKEEHANATVTQCHTGTAYLPEFTRQADILVAAMGRPGAIIADWVKPGAAVLDVGITRSETGLVGDVAPDVADVAGWLAPVPGGVGPMTRALLLRNVVEAAERRAGRVVS